AISHEPPNATHRQPQVFWRVLFQVPLECLQMVFERRLLLLSRFLLNRVDEAQLSQSRLFLFFCGSLFGQAAVGEALCRPPLSFMVEPLKEVGRALLFAS